MKRYYVDFTDCSECDRKKYERILGLAFDHYTVANNPNCYEVMWSRSEPLTDFIPFAYVRLQQNT